MLRENDSNISKYLGIEYDDATAMSTVLLSIMCYVAVAPKLVVVWCIIDE